MQNHSCLIKVTPSAPDHKTQHPPSAQQSSGLDDPPNRTIVPAVAISSAAVRLPRLLESTGSVGVGAHADPNEPIIGGDTQRVVFVLVLTRTVSFVNSRTLHYSQFEQCSSVVLT
ncbi:MAG: hypothetical protein ABI557_16950, partial [Aureliella sp.]